MRTIARVVARGGHVEACRPSGPETQSVPQLGVIGRSNEERKARWRQSPTGLEMSAASISHHFEDAALEREVTNEIRDHDVGALRQRHLSGVAAHKPDAVRKPVRRD